MSDPISPAAADYAERFTRALPAELVPIADWTREHTSSPQMMSGLQEARLLEALVVAGGARHVLEVGTFTGLGSLMIAAALPDGGQLTTLEIDEENAATAQRHFDASPFGDRIELLVGPALASIEALSGPFDLVYIDADKRGYPAYYEAVVPKLADRGVIVADNLFRGGQAMDASIQNEDVGGIREFAQVVQADVRVHNVLLTIGDGVMLAWKAPGS